MTNSNSSGFTCGGLWPRASTENFPGGRGQRKKDEN